MRRAVPQKAGGQVDKVVGLIMFWLSFVAVALLAGADLVRAVISVTKQVISAGGGQ